MRFNLKCCFSKVRGRLNLFSRGSIKLLGRFCAGHLLLLRRDAPCTKLFPRGRVGGRAGAKWTTYWDPFSASAASVPEEAKQTKERWIFAEAALGILSSSWIALVEAIKKLVSLRPALLRSLSEKMQIELNQRVHRSRRAGQPLGAPLIGAQVASKEHQTPD